MESVIVSPEAKTSERTRLMPLALLAALAGWMERTVSDLEGTLALGGKSLPAWAEKLWDDVRAESNPIKTVAVGFILIGIALVIALTILPVITSAVNTAAGDGNISASDATLLRLLPTLLIVGLLAGGVAFLFQGFKQVRMN